MLGVTKAKYGADSDFTSIAKRLRRVGRRRDARLTSQMAATARRSRVPRGRSACGWRTRSSRTRGAISRPRSSRRRSSASRPALLRARVRRSAVEPAGRRRRARATRAALARRRRHHRHARRRVRAGRRVRERRDRPRARARRHARRQREPSRHGARARRCSRSRRARERERQGFPDRARRGLRGRRQGRPHDHRRRRLEDLPADGHHGPDRRRGRRREAARLDAGADGHGARARRERGGRLQRMGRAPAAARCSSTPASPRAAPSRPCSSRPRARTRRAPRSTARPACSRRSTATSPPPMPELFADRPEILAVFFKPVPACNFAQSPAQAALAIAQRKRLRATDIDRVDGARDDAPRRSIPAATSSGPFEHILQAKMSIHYNVAAALAHGNFAERNYVPQQNADVLQLATRYAARDRRRASRKRSRRKQGAERHRAHARGRRARASASRTSCRRMPTACASGSSRPPRSGSARSARKELDRVIATLETVTDAGELARLAMLPRA